MAAQPGKESMMVKLEKMGNSYINDLEAVRHITFTVPAFLLGTSGG